MPPETATPRKNVESLPISLAAASAALPKPATPKPTSLALNKPRLDNLADEIWKSAERLRGKFKAYEYQGVILPVPTNCSTTPASSPTSGFCGTRNPPTIAGV